MKIALIRQKYTHFGGAERYTASLAEELARQHHEVHIFARSWKLSEHESHTDIIFHRVPVVKGLSVFELLSFAINVRRMLRKDTFDIIHSFEKTLFQDIYRAGDGCHREWLLRRRTIESRVRWLSHYINPLHIALLWIEKRLFDPHGSFWVIANSKRGKEEITRHYGFPEERIRVIHTPVDTGRFKTEKRISARHEIRQYLGVPEDAPLLLFVGSGFKRKGVGSLLRALPFLRENVHLAVIGKERLHPYVHTADRMGLHDRVHFLGPRQDVEQFYQAADLFVFPTIYEPFSNVCLEAMAAGLPVVTSCINGASEVITNGKNGYLLEDPLNAREIAEKIGMAMLLEPAMVRQWNETLLKTFSWSRHIEEIMEVYHNVIQERKHHD